jgi:hypothetical protein
MSVPNTEAAAAAAGDTTAAAAVVALGTDAAAAAAAAAGDSAAAAAAVADAGAAADAGQAAAGQADADAAAAAAAAAAPAGAPDKYELTVPDGSLLDEADVAAIEAMGRTHNWTNEQAQAALAESGTALDAQRARFLEQTVAHPEIGGDKLEQSQAFARAALDKFLPSTTAEGQELRRALDKSGYGNYAPLAVFLARIGKAMGEDAPSQAAAGAGAGAVKRNHAEVLFGGAVSKK